MCKREIHFGEMRLFQTTYSKKTAIQMSVILPAKQTYFHFYAQKEGLKSIIGEAYLCSFTALQTESSKYYL
jgi:hypothetical protein